LANNVSVKAKRVAFGPCLLVLTIFSFFPCGGCNLESDARLKSSFDKNSADFSQLVIMSNLDNSAEGIGLVSTLPKASGISEQRWEEYQRLFYKLGIRDGIGHRPDFPSVVFLYVECQGSAITRDCKGYAYSEKPPKPIVNNLNKLALALPLNPCRRIGTYFAMEANSAAKTIVFCELSCPK
jgi:hypothetical protein